MQPEGFREYSEYIRRTGPEVLQRASEFAGLMQRRRTVRHFAADPVDPQVIDLCLTAAVQAPSGANLQPWKFVVVTSPSVRQQIRQSAEAEEREFYETRAPEEWLRALSPLGTDSVKPFLEDAPVLIVVFAEAWRQREANGGKATNYYVSESVGIAVGFLLTALQYAGLAALTHTPSPMGFLNSILGRPANERPYLIVVAGYPATGCQIPDISRKSMDEVVLRV